MISVLILAGSDLMLMLSFVAERKRNQKKRGMPSFLKVHG
jgi:hypothetical protein